MQRHQPRKRFGQHFLTDYSVIDGLIREISPRKNDFMIEIGPGLAALTRPISEYLDHLYVVELDRDLAKNLRETFSAEHLTVFEQDVLTFDFGQFAEQKEPPLRVIGNLPYNISSPILFHLAQYKDNIDDMHFMLQKEVVDRIVAMPSTAAYSRLSVMLQVNFEVDSLFDVPPEAFDPPPKVDSAIVRLIPKKLPDWQKEPNFVTCFKEVVTAAFSQRRKTLRNTLKRFLTDEDFVALALDPQLRAENLPVQTYQKIACFLLEKNPLSQ